MHQHRMISHSSQDYRLHADAFRSLRDSCLSTDSRMSISEKSDSKKCAFECWLPDNNYYYHQTAVKFRSATRVISGPTVSDVKWRRNIVHHSSRRYDLVGGAAASITRNPDANDGAETNNLTSHAQSISQVTRSTVGGQPLIHTRFSVHSRSYNSRPWKDISSRLPSSSTSSYCSMVVTRDMQKYICKANKPGRRFSLFRTTSRRGIARLRSAGDVWASSNLPSDCSHQQAALKCAELQCNLHNGEGSGGCGPAGVGTLPVYHKKALNTNFKEAAIAHIMTESLQTGNDVRSREEVGTLRSAALLPEAMKTEEHMDGGKHSDAERFWNKLWNNIPTSGAEENLSVVKLRQMAGKLIESLICKIRLQLDADIHPSTGELECATNENEANKHVESQHYNRSDEERVTRGGERHTTDDHRHLREDDNAAAGGGGGEGKHRCRHQASEEELRFLTRAQGLEGAASQQKIFVNQDDMQPVIHRSTDKNDDKRDQRHGLQSPSELSAKSAARGSDRGAFPLQSVRRFDVEADHRRESKRPIQENRGAHNDKSSLTSSMITASSDYDGSSSFNDEGEDEDEMGRSDISLESRRYHGLVDVISYMILQRQQMSVQRSDQLTNNSNNDYVKKTEAVKYRSERPSESDPSSSSSVEEENEEEEEEESSEPSSGEFGPRLEVPGASPANIREPKFLSAVQSTSPSAKNESETTSSAPSSSSSIKKESETTSSVPSSSSSIKKESETTSSAPSSSPPMKTGSESTSSVPSSSPPMKTGSESTSSVPSSSPPTKTGSESTSSVPSSSPPTKTGSERMSSVPSSSSIRKESEHMSSVPNASSSIKKGSSVPNPSSSKRKKSERMPLAPSSSSSVRKESKPKLEVVYNSWEAKPSVGKDALSGRGVVAATRSHSILSTMEEGGLDGTTEHATMSAEAEATLKSFATEVVQSLYAAIRFKLKSLVDDIKDETKKQEILQRGDIELRSQILPTIIEHIVWIIKEEFRGQDEAKWKEAMMQDPGQYLDTIVTNAVMKTHADHRMRKRSFLKTFVVTSNFRQSSKWKL